jgi:5-aminolevulinate synthase
MPGTVVFSDALNHASMIAGIRKSRAEKHIFRHSDPADLARLLDRVPADRPKLVCFESVIRWTATSRRSANCVTSPTGMAR